MPQRNGTRVWDLPVRLVHWLLVIGLVAQWYTAEEGYMEVHGTIGTSLLALLLFRLLWGLFGSTTARFTDFVRGPRAVAAHVHALFSSAYTPRPGHNPAGGWMVLILLAALLAQALMGLFAVDDIGLFYGPLAGLVSQKASETIAHWHHEWFGAILILAVLHILAVLFYATVKRETLIRPMITGRKPLRAEGLEFASPGRAVALFLLSVVLVWGGIALLQTFG